MVLSKNSRFRSEEAINYIPCTEKRKQVPTYEMLQSSGSFSSSMLLILLGKLKIIALWNYNTNRKENPAIWKSQHRHVGIDICIGIFIDIGI